MSINWNTYGTDSLWDAGNVERPWHKDGLIAPEIKKYLAAQGFTGPLSNQSSYRDSFAGLMGREKYLAKRDAVTDEDKQFYDEQYGRDIRTETGSQELVDWLKSKGLTLQSGATVEGGDESDYVSRLLDASGNNVAVDQYHDGKSNWQKLAPMIAVGGLAAMTGGALAPVAAGTFGAGTIGAGALTGAGAGAVGGGVTSALNDGFGSNILTAALRGGLSGAIGGGLAAGAGQLANGGDLSFSNSGGNFLQAPADITPITAADHAANMADLQLGPYKPDFMDYAPSLGTNFLQAPPDIAPIRLEDHLQNMDELGYPTTGGSFLQGPEDITPITRADHQANLDDLKLDPYNPEAVDRLPGKDTGILKDLLKFAPSIAAALRGGGGGGMALDLGTIKRGGIVDAPRSPLAAVDNSATWQPAGLVAALRQRG